MERSQTRGETRQLAGQWRGQTRAGWMTSQLVQEPCLEENGEDGFKRASDMRHHVYQVKSWAVHCGESCSIWFVLHDILID